MFVFLGALLSTTIAKADDVAMQYRQGILSIKEALLNNDSASALKQINALMSLPSKCQAMAASQKIPQNFTDARARYWQWSSVLEHHACGFDETEGAKADADQGANGQCLAAGFTVCQLISDDITKSGPLDPSDIGQTGPTNFNFTAGCIATAIVRGVN